MTIRKKSRKLEEGLKKTANSIGETLTISQVKLEKTGRKAVKEAARSIGKSLTSSQGKLKKTGKKAVKNAEKIGDGLKKTVASIGKTLTNSQGKFEKTGRKVVKKAGKIGNGLKKTAHAIGKTLTSSQVKLEKSGRKAVKKTEKLLEGITHSAEEVLTKTANKLKRGKEQTGGDQERGSSRFKGIGRKSVAEAIGKLAEEIRLYMEEHEEIGASKLLSVMKSRGHSDAMVFAGMGWLVRDKKISLSSDGKKVSLA